MLEANTSFMLSPVRKCVAFQGVDWAVQAEKAEQRLERCKKARQQRRAQQRKDQDEQLQSFLRFAASNDDENAQKAICMEGYFGSRLLEQNAH